MQNKPLLYESYSVVFQEVPDEISLCIWVTGCDKHCPGCHSEYLWEYQGLPLYKAFKEIVEKYRGLITCVCFMGGDQNISELTDMLRYTKSLGLKTCLYTGADHSEHLQPILPLLDYVKTGHYDQERGGLASKKTNQTFFKKIEDQYGDHEWVDITYRFWDCNKVVKE